MLNKIYEILSRNELKWFLDSGSLLGIIREKKFLDWDRGIDISILYENSKIKNLENAVEELGALGFYVTRNKWNGNIYKYILTTKNSEVFKYNIDLHLFVKYGDNYVCPQIKSKVSKNYFIKTLDFFLAVKKGNLVYLKEKSVVGVMKYIVKKVYHCMICWHVNDLNMEKYVPKRANVYYWKIPKEYVTDIVVASIGGHKMPGNPERYLEYRYGDWRTPNPNWDFMRDDPSITEASANEINQIANLYK